MVIVLIDPGLGRKNLIRCLAEAEPEGFVAISLAQAGRVFLRGKFPHAKWNVTVGRRWCWGGLTLDELRARGAQQVGRESPTNESDSTMVGGAHPTSTLVGGAQATLADDPAAIIFTSGSTGPPKGVLYTQRMFDTQVAEIQAAYDIAPSGVDLACFPLFALFNSAMGVTTVLPDMDFSRPASANPNNLLAAANDWQVTQAFASPAVWRVLGDHSTKTGSRIPSLKQVFSCGAPVPAEVLETTLGFVGDGAKMHTPYGATECLPVATIEASEVLRETAARTDNGVGVCVGRKFNSIDWRVIRITDDPIATIDDAEELPNGEIGELVVRGLQVSPRYVTRVEVNAVAKIAKCGLRSADSSAHSGIRTLESEFSTWHRTGDVGYFDDQQRFWYCGRKSQRVETTTGQLYTECVEAIFNSHPIVHRSALVGIGPKGQQVPAVVIELKPDTRRENWRETVQIHAQSQNVTQSISHILEYPSLPVDVRHNAKINREFLARWAANQLSLPQPPTPSR